MNIEDANKLIAFLKDNGYEAELREDYSGRNMFGENTNGVVTDASFVIMESFHYLSDIGIDNYREDNMGKSFIYY